MRVIFCGGGTAGHIYPGIAMAEIIADHESHSEFLFVGRKDGPENDAVVRAGYSLKTIEVYGIKRAITFENIKRVFGALKAVDAAGEIIDEFLPDIIIGTGGYVCWPVLRAGMKRNIPAVIHESNASPGLVTKLLAKKCDRLLLGFPGAANRLGGIKSAVVVGNPVRKGFKTTARGVARARLGIRADEFLIVSFGGSIGAERLNTSVCNLISADCTHGATIVHATGKRYYNEYSARYPMLARKNGSRIIPYIDDMPLWLSAADLAITRSGAITLAELSAVGVPSILVPSPNVSGNHQMINAEAMAAGGGSVIIKESELNEKTLADKICKLMSSDKVRDEMRTALSKDRNQDTPKLIWDAIKSIAEKNARR